MLRPYHWDSTVPGKVRNLLHSTPAGVSCARMCQRYAERPRTRHFSKTTARVVSPVSARFAVAPHHGSISHLALGNHAATDARRGGDSLLRTISAALPGRSHTCRCAARRSAASLVRSRVLQPRAQPAEGGAANRGQTCGTISETNGGRPRIARHRKLHRGGDSEHRLG